MLAMPTPYCTHSWSPGGPATCDERMRKGQHARAASPKSHSLQRAFPISTQRPIVVTKKWMIHGSQCEMLWSHAWWVSEHVPICRYCSKLRAESPAPRQNLWASQKKIANKIVKSQPFDKQTNHLTLYISVYLCIPNLSSLIAYCLRIWSKCYRYWPIVHAAPQFAASLKGALPKMLCWHASSIAAVEWWRLCLQKPKA